MRGFCLRNAASGAAPLARALRLQGLSHAPVRGGMYQNHNMFRGSPRRGIAPNMIVRLRAAFLNPPWAR